MRKALRYAAAVLVLLLLLTGCEFKRISGGPPADEIPADLPREFLEEILADSPEELLEIERERGLEPEPEPEEIRGLPPETTVYVSDRSSTIHKSSDCSNMKHYREMTLADADAEGYHYCLKCF